MLAAGFDGGVSCDMSFLQQRVRALCSNQTPRRVVHAAPGPVSANGERCKVLSAHREDRPSRVLILPPTLHGLIAQTLKLQAGV